MPVEIRELVIKATVSDESGKSSVAPTLPQKNEPAKEEQIVQRCVEQVLEILRVKNER
jgi:hypothetical protein